MRKLTKKNKRDIKATLRKKTRTLISPTCPRFSMERWSGAEIGKFYRPHGTRVTKTPKQPKFALCVRSDDSEDLEQRKVYQVLPDRAAAREGYVRIVDESGGIFSILPTTLFRSNCLPQRRGNYCRHVTCPRLSWYTDA
jgi:hypothetical protein